MTSSATGGEHGGGWYMPPAPGPEPRSGPAPISYASPTYAVPTYSMPTYEAATHPAPSLYVEPEAGAETYEPPTKPCVVQDRPEPIQADQVPRHDDGPGEWADTPYPGGSEFVPAGEGATSPLVPAAYGLRLAARLIDAITFVALLAVLGLGFRDTTLGSVTVSLDQNKLGGAYVLALLVEMSLTATVGGSLGKLVTGLRIADQRTGRIPANPISAALRGFLLITAWGTCVVPGVVLGLSPLFSPSRQGWHDILARTVVVKKPMS